MLGRKAREMQETITQRDAEIMQLKLKIDELNATIAQYRVQESAIAGALTRAQTAATGIINDAQSERDGIINAANDHKAEAEREGAEIIADAQRRAEIIESEARAKARHTAERAEAFMADYKLNAKKIEAEIKRVADEAAANARRFGESMSALDLSAAIEFAGEYDHASATAEMPAQDMPDDYVDPASLMRSIYSLEQRELPDSVQEGEEAEGEEADEAQADDVPSAEEPANEEPANEEPVNEEPANEESAKEDPTEVTQSQKPSADPFRSWINSAAAEAGEPPIEAADAKPHEEERVWTVEEIVERTSANENADIDAELNAIIDDVLKGS